MPHCFSIRSTLARGRGVLLTALAISGAHGPDASQHPAAVQDPAPTAPPAQDDASSPPPATKLGKMRAVVARYALDYGTDEDHHELELTYAFPERSRWVLTVPASKMRIFNRFGAKAYKRTEHNAQSQQLDGAELLDQIREMDLMQAALLWPDAFPWRDASGSHLHQLGPVGFLLVDPFEGKRPTTFHALDASGMVRASLGVEAWVEQHARAWPARWRLDVPARGENKAVELNATLLAVAVDGRFLDGFFVPPDRRPRSAARVVENLRHVDMPARDVRRFALTGAPGWDERIEAARKLYASWQKRVPDLTPWMFVELDGRARASALWLARRGERETPEGWTRRPAGGALAVTLGHSARVRRDLLQKMRSKLESEVLAGAPLVRLPVDPEGSLDVLLPLFRRD